MLECSICYNQYIPTKYGKSPTCSPACTALHIANTLRERAKKIRDEKILEYNKNPTLCKQCQNSLDYGKRKGLFCDSSCAASFNSTGRVRTEESKTLISTKMNEFNINRKQELLKQGLMVKDVDGNIKNPIYITFRFCKICLNIHRKAGQTCSKKCTNILSSRKMSIWLKDPEHRKIYKGNSGKSYLEQSFEQWLISNGIEEGMKGYLTELHFYNKETKKHGWADFVFPHKNLIIELDGSHHNKRKMLDQVRDAHLKSRGWDVIRITHKEYRSRARMQEIKEMLGLN